MNRRLFLCTGAALGTSFAASKRQDSETVYRFVAGDCDVSMAVEFFDNYSSKGFYFQDRRAQRRFCLSEAGEENHGCLPNFIGSIAIAHYHVRCHSRPSTRIALRERVRTIDQEIGLNSRAPFERTIEMQDGVASDIQAFGYQANDSSESRAPATADAPWYLLRQDLYLEDADALFLVVHWKHTLSAIRLLDVIPAGRTRMLAEPGSANRRIE